MSGRGIICCKKRLSRKIIFHDTFQRKNDTFGADFDAFYPNFRSEKVWYLYNCQRRTKIAKAHAVFLLLQGACHQVGSLFFTLFLGREGMTGMTEKQMSIANMIRNR